MRKKHWPEVRKIYQMGIDTGIATFETKAPPMKIWNKKFHKKCRFVAIKNKEVVGWAALQPVSDRKAYSGVAEETVYVHPKYWGHGIAGKLLQSLINESEKQGFWMLTAIIFKSNQVSIHLHKKFGFKIVGTRKKIAMRDGIWTDTVIMDRRSKVVGVD